MILTIKLILSHHLLNKINHILNIIKCLGTRGIVIYLCAKINKLHYMKSHIITSAIALGMTIGASAFDNVDFTKAAEATVNGVVSVKSFATVQNRFGMDAFSDPFFEYFFGTPSSPRRQQQPSEPQQRGLGSGVIIDKTGYIVTNNHVIDGAERLEVTLNDNRTFDATVVGTDPLTDIALIRIDNAENLHVIPLGNSEKLRVGEWVLAVGNPFGFTSSVTAGIVSAKGRNISSVSGARSQGIESFIQTDAAVNPGNSGGALVNLEGELVGINTAIYSQTGNYSGSSFAVPVSIVEKVVEDLKKYGTVQRALLGLTYTEITPKFAREKDLNTVSGLYVAQVSDNGAAKEAGIKEGDIIVAIDSYPTTTSGQLQEVMTRRAPGDEVKITVKRDDKELTVTAKLRNAKGDTGITRQGDVASLGASFAPLSKDEINRLGIRSGVKVTSVEKGSFKNAGIKEGFIIIDINNAYVTSAADVEKLYKSIKSSDEYDHVMFITGIYEGSSRRVYYAVDIAD